MSTDVDGGFPSGVYEAAAVQAVNRSSVAALAFLVYDVALTFGDEINFIWLRPWTYTKILFFYVRYMAIVIQFSTLFITGELSFNLQYSHHACYIWQVWQGGSVVSVTLAVDFILILRVHALYGGNKIITSIIGFFYIAEIVAMITSLVIAIPGMDYDSICLINYSPSLILLCGAASVLFQGLLFGFTAYQFFVGLRRGRGRLVTLLMRDGTWAFFLIFSIVVLYTILLVVDTTYSGIFYGWTLTALSIAGYRILLNLQSLSPSPRTRSTTTTTDTSRYTDTRIEFTTNLNAGRSADDGYGGPSQFDTMWYGSEEYEMDIVEREGQG
ncbi:hypothetical protein JAAARDRAFT_60123 [Jaapia argillacea MUCL 33604]|uniref:DUF6533 domain-containing protein n=1 Tax=Jaapia argillacea MUCL 33604 TaxID=933084 RepID=A0A067PXV2_9AGAM|nr:hypothetical protein JAAARDRAFT_60123 [Jaapia argillacea MUCL 33604]